MIAPHFLPLYRLTSTAMASIIPSSHHGLVDTLSRLGRGLLHTSAAGKLVSLDEGEIQAMTDGCQWVDDRRNAKL